MVAVVIHQSLDCGGSLSQLYKRVLGCSVSENRLSVSNGELSYSLSDRGPQQLNAPVLDDVSATPAKFRCIERRRSQPFHRVAGCDVVLDPKLCDNSFDAKVSIAVFDVSLFFDCVLFCPCPNLSCFSDCLHSALLLGG